MGWPHVDGGDSIDPPNTSAAAVSDQPDDSGGKVIDITGQRHAAAD
jgi:hypothetical protein